MCGMSETGSAVVELMQKAATDSWKKWRAHLAAGTGETPAALEAFDAAVLAGRTWAGEVADRAASAAKHASRAA